jgi:hypothetical protein
MDNLAVCSNILYCPYFAWRCRVRREMPLLPVAFFRMELITRPYQLVPAKRQSSMVLEFGSLIAWQLWHED